MARVISYVTEDDIGFMESVDVEFVSLVGHAANRQPFKIIKGEVKDMPSKTIYKVLVPVDGNEEKVKEIADNHSFTLENKTEDELEGFNVYKQVEDEHVECESQHMVALDKEQNIYGIVADLKEEDEEKAMKAELSEETIWDLSDALMAMADVVFGTLRQPESSKANRKNTVLMAVDNFRKYAEAILSNTKTEDVLDLDQVEVKGENLESLFYQVTTEEEPDEDMEKQEKHDEIQKEVKKQIAEGLDQFEKSLDAFIEKVHGQVDEKIKTQFDELKSGLNEELSEKMELLTEKEEFKSEVDNLKNEIEEIKNTTKERKGEVDEDTSVHKEPKRPARKKWDFVTLA